MSEQGYSLVMPFLDGSKSFVHGFECGQVWEEMERGEPIERNINAANIEQIRLMAKVHDYKVDFEEYAPSLDPEGTWRRMIGAPGPKVQ